MTVKLNCVWVDDKADRAASFVGALDGTLRGQQVETKLEVVAITEDLAVNLDRLVEQWTVSPPDLLMLDHDFSKVPKRLFDMHGSALAHLLRIRLSNTPIVCVSGQSINSDEFSVEDLSEYTYLFDINEVHNEKNLERLFAIAVDFKLLCFPAKQAVRQALVDVLNPPDIDRTPLLNILPDEFEGTYVHSASPHRIARWVLNVLMNHQGFLYNALEAATFIGVTEAAFLSKIKANFNGALYQGPFATEATPLWWASALTNCLYSALPQHTNLAPAEAGRKFEGITEDDFSRCAVTNEHTPAPDVVAYTDATESERRAVRHPFTVPVSSDASAVFGFSTRLRIRNSRRGN